MTYESLLKKTCTIQTKSEAQTGLGEITTTWADTYTNVKCRFNRNKTPSVIGGSYQTTLEDFIFYFLATEVITKADQIVADGETYEVMHVFEDSASHHKEVYARRKSFE